MEKEKQRDIWSKQDILSIIIRLRENAADRDLGMDIIVNKEKCKAVGTFYYKIKGKEKGSEERLSQLFLISETHDGKEVNLIYDDQGKLIAWRELESKDAELKIASDIELDEKVLNKQLEMEEGENDTSSSDTQKAGSGRDLADKEHEEVAEEKDEETQDKEEKEEEKESRILPNLRGKVSINNYSTITNLNQIINGYYLWEILNLEEKLKGRVPDGISETSFRNGFLTAVPSSELTKADGKERKSKDSLIICTADESVMIELDEEIIEPQEWQAPTSQFNFEKSTYRQADGKEPEKPDDITQLTQTGLYKIPNANERFAAGEDYYLSINENTEYKQNGEMPFLGKTKEISFGQLKSAQTYEDKEVYKRGMLETKLEDRQEPNPNTKEEQKQQEQLSEKNYNEAENVRNEHIEKLTNECFAKYHNLRKYL